MGLIRKCQRLMSLIEVKPSPIGYTEEMVKLIETVDAEDDTDYPSGMKLRFLGVYARGLLARLGGSEDCDGGLDELFECLNPAATGEEDGALQFDAMKPVVSAIDGDRTCKCQITAKIFIEDILPCLIDTTEDQAYLLIKVYPFAFLGWVGGSGVGVSVCVKVEQLGWIGKWLPGEVGGWLSGYEGRAAFLQPVHQTEEVGGIVYIAGVVLGVDMLPSSLVYSCL